MKQFLLILLFIPLTLSAQYSVPLADKQNGNKLLTASIDGIPVRFVFDSGCSSLSINRDIFDQLVRRGLVSAKDLSEPTPSLIADGRTHLVCTFIIHRLQIGDCLLRDVEASVGVDDLPDALPLLGQTVLERFESYTVAGNRLYFSPKPEDEQRALATAQRLAGDSTQAAQARIVQALEPYVQRLAPHYLFLYANALCHSERYAEAIRVAEFLIESGSYADEDDDIRHLIICSELNWASDFYNEEQYAESEQHLLRALKLAQQEPAYTSIIEPTLHNLCHTYLAMDDYPRAEQAVRRYADWLLAPATMADLQRGPVRDLPDLSRLFSHLAQYYTYLGDDASADRYRRLCRQTGNHTD